MKNKGELDTLDLIISFLVGMVFGLSIIVFFFSSGVSASYLNITENPRDYLIKQGYAEYNKNTGKFYIIEKKHD